MSSCSWIICRVTFERRIFSWQQNLTVAHVQSCSLFQALQCRLSYILALCHNVMNNTLGITPSILSFNIQIPMKVLLLFFQKLLYGEEWNFQHHLQNHLRGTLIPLKKPHRLKLIVSGVFFTFSFIICNSPNHWCFRIFFRLLWISYVTSML